MPDKYNAQELTNLLRQNPEVALEYLFQNYYTLVSQIIFRIVPHRSTTEDLAQEVFYELWRKRKHLVFTTSPEAYLKKSARNKSLNYLRDQRWYLQDAPLPILPDQRPPITQEMAADELQREVDHLIDQLPERCRLIFVLSRFHDMTYQEIADDLGISRKTVENQLSKALRQLRKGLDPYL